MNQPVGGVFIPQLIYVNSLHLSKRMLERLRRMETIMKRIIFIIFIAASSVYAQDHYFDSNVYHKIDCSEKKTCYITSYEKGLLWDSKIHMVALEKHWQNNIFHSRYDNVTVAFFPQPKRLEVYIGFEKPIYFRCQLTDKKQYTCADRQD